MPHIRSTTFDRDFDYFADVYTLVMAWSKSSQINEKKKIILATVLLEK